MRNDSIHTSRCFGYANPITREIVTPAHRFRIASVSKPITAIAIFQLIEQDRLRLTDKIFGPGAVLGTSYGALPYGPHIGNITVRHLLEHTSGGWPNDNNDPMFQQISLNHHDLISWTLDKVPLLFAPGTQYLYSNFGYCLLGRVIEAISGLSTCTTFSNSSLPRAALPALRSQEAAPRIGSQMKQCMLAKISTHRITCQYDAWILTAAGLARRTICFVSCSGWTALRTRRISSAPQRSPHDDAFRSECRLRERLGGQLQRHAVA